MTKEEKQNIDNHQIELHSVLFKLLKDIETNISVTQIENLAGLESVIISCICDIHEHPSQNLKIQKK